MKDYAVRYYYILLISTCVFSRVDGDVLKRLAFMSVKLSACVYSEIYV